MESSSILNLVLRILFTIVLSLAACGLSVPSILTAEDPSTEGDSFFAGKVAEFSSVKLVVTRTVLGKVENHAFKMSSATKVEGKLSKKVRVTVRYNSDDDTATLVVVRPPVPLPPNK